MNKILIVGHPASGHGEVEALLHRCGMQPAQPSLRDGLTPQGISAALRKAHRAPVLADVKSEDEIQQLQVGAVWHGMALDLMLGNIDQPLWGWADPSAICTLDYWRDLDPKLTFVLVYDEPHRALIEAARIHGEMPDGAFVRKVLDNWVAYNCAMLAFHLRNPGRSLLVHAGKVQRAIDSYVQQLQPLLDMPLPQAAALIDASADVPSSDQFECSTAADLPSALREAVVLVGGDEHKAAADFEMARAERYLVDGLLADYPVALQLYSELQSAANLPLDGMVRAEYDATSAWRSLLRQRTFVVQAVGRVHTELGTRLKSSNDAKELLISTLQTEQAARAKSEADLKSATEFEQKFELAREENDLLLSQLHKAQEDLESHYLRKLELEKCNAALSGTNENAAKVLAETTAKRDALVREIEDVQVKLQAERAARAKSEAELKSAAELDKKYGRVLEEKDLLLSQLHKVQEELERYYLENKRLEKYQPKPKPPGPYGAADRVKRQLSYRLGAVMIAQARSTWGLMSLPWALATEVRAYRRDRAARGGKKQPAIHTYCDAHEAERVKRHLSYRLGSALIAHGRSPSGWLKLPFALRREVRDFRLARGES